MNELIHFIELDVVLFHVRYGSAQEQELSIFILDMKAIADILLREIQLIDILLEVTPQISVQPDVPPMIIDSLERKYVGFEGRVLCRRPTEPWGSTRG